MNPETLTSRIQHYVSSHETDILKFMREICARNACPELR